MRTVSLGLRLLTLVFTLGWGATAQAQIVVTTTDDGLGIGSLRDAILEANEQGSADQTITFDSSLTGSIVLDSALPNIDVGDGTLTIDGTATAGRIPVDGQDLYRVFFVESGDVTIERLGVDNGSGAGGDGGSRGGGGLGAGGGLFVDEGATVTLDDVFFDSNSATGGAGGSGADGSGAGGGGGGLLGDGGDGDGGGGGGGGFLDDPDSLDAVVDGDDGTPGLVVGSGGDGAGMKNDVATGGVGGDVGAQPSPALPYGGGGGAGPEQIQGIGGGDGGVFGGGGGGSGAGEGGDGGFGGGGGGTSTGTEGEGGFGGGAGGTGGAASAGGGGGDALGGAIFVREGGQLTMVESGVVADDVTGVVAGVGADGGEDGSAAGAALYLMQDVDVTVEVTSNRTLFGSISGEGGITKTGPGSLTLFSPDNDYSGGTNVQEGSLVGSGAEAIQGAVVLASADVKLEVTEGDMAGKELTAFISGAGTFQKSGAGKVILNPTGGTNSWTGGTLVSSGTLETSAGSLPGSGTVTVTGALVLNEPDVADDQTWSGDLDGGGAFTKIGPGTSRLTGSNSFIGTFLVQEGTLRGSVDSLPPATANPLEIDDDATLVFDQGSDATFSGAVASVDLGDGNLEKAGAGTLTFDGDSSQFTGDTTVSGGALKVTGTIGSSGSGAVANVDSGNLILDGDGTLHADATVASGARISGSTSGSSFGLQGNLDLFGAVSPGNSVGTLHVAGDVTFEPGSVYELEFDLDAPATADLLDVDGEANLDGLVAVTLGGTGSGDTVTILTAADGVNNEFGGITNEPGFFIFDLTYLANAVKLEVTFDESVSFEDFATTPNQIAVATALDPPPDPGVNFDDPWNSARFELTKIPGQLPAVFDELGGEALTAFTTPRLANAQEVGRVVSARMRQVGGREVGSAGTVDFLIAGSRREPVTRLAELGGALLASNDAGHALSLAATAPTFGAMPPPEGQRFGFWVDGYGVLGDLDGDANSAGTDWWSAGVLLGFDVTLGEHGLLGLSGGWSRVTPSVDGRSLDGEADVYQGGLYGAYVGERLYVGGLARYGFSDFDTSRTLRFSGTSLDGTARGSFNGHEAGGFVELGYVAFAPGGYQIEPMLAGHFNWLSQEGFVESGSDPEIDALSLDTRDGSWTSIVSALGVRVHKQFLVERDLAIQPEIWGAWAHEYGDRDRALSARFKGALPGDARFRVLGATAARDGGQFGAGWSMSRNDLSVFFYYDGNVNADLISHGLTAGVLMRW